MSRLTNSDSEQAWNALTTLLHDRIAEGFAGGVSTKSIGAIVDEELSEDSRV